MGEAVWLRRAIEAATRDTGGRKVLACAEAFAIAERLKVPVARVGRTCNRLGIKIGTCQLGCFP